MIKAILFDVFGTIVDWRTGIVQGLDRAFARSGNSSDTHAIADDWRARCFGPPPGSDPSPPNCQQAGTPIPEALAQTLANFDLQGHLGEEGVVTLTRIWEKLPPWPDSVPGLRALKREYVIAPCTTSSIASMIWLAKYAGLPWDVVLEADIAADSREPTTRYAAAATALGLAPDEVMMVSAHNADLYPARDAGLKTAFFARPKEHGSAQVSDLAPSEAWDVVAFDLLDFARQMETAARY